MIDSEKKRERERGVILRYYIVGLTANVVVVPHISTSTGYGCSIPLTVKVSGRASARGVSFPKSRSHDSFIDKLTSTEWPFSPNHSPTLSTGSRMVVFARPSPIGHTEVVNFRSVGVHVETFMAQCPSEKSIGWQFVLGQLFLLTELRKKKKRPLTRRVSFRTTKNPHKCWNWIINHEK